MKLWFEEIGEGPPVVFISGLGYASWCWREQNPLANHHRLLKVDNRGAGRSPKPPGPYSIPEMAEDVLETVGAHAPFHLVGHSLGGYLAMTIAINHPEAARSLTLVATSAGGPDHIPVPQSTLDAWVAEGGKPPEQYARATMHLSFSPGWTDNHPAEYERWLLERLEFPTPPEPWAAQYAAGSEYLHAGLGVESVNQPTLIFHGELDRVLPTGNGQELANRIPRSRLIALRDCGHLVQMEMPAIFNCACESFWFGVESAN